MSISIVILLCFKGVQFLNDSEKDLISDFTVSEISRCEMSINLDKCNCSFIYVSTEEAEFEEKYVIFVSFFCVVTEEAEFEERSRELLEYKDAMLSKYRQLLFNESQVSDLICHSLTYRYQLSAF